MKSIRWLFIMIVPALILVRSCTSHAPEGRGSSDLGQSDWGDVVNGPVINPPAWVNDHAFILSYPAMEHVADLGELTLWPRAEGRSSRRYDASFPVLIWRLDFQPYDVLNAPMLSYPRPMQMRQRFAADTNQRPSAIDGLDMLFVSVDDANGERRELTHSSVYVNSRGRPYDLEIICDDYKCTGEVYSERTRFRYRMTFPSQGMTLAYTLVEAIDKTLVSWSHPGSTLPAFYRAHATGTTLPELDAQVPEPCVAPRYRTVAVSKKMDAPASYIAVDADENVIVGSRQLMGIGNEAKFRNRIYRTAGGSLQFEKPQERWDYVDSVALEGLATDQNGYVYLVRKGKVLRIVPKDTYLDHLLMGFPTSEGSITFDAHGNLYSIHFDSGSVQKTVNPGRVFGQKTSIVASGIHRANDLAVDQAGAVYVTDESGGVIHKIDQTGKRSIFASGLRAPGGIGIDASGNVFVLDRSKAPIKKIGPSGIVCAVSIGAHDYSSIAVSRAGNLYVTNYEAAKVKKFAPK